MAHQDLSEALKLEGVGVTLISAGKYKTEASPFEPLTEEARAALQKTVNAYYDAFVSAVSKGRDVRASEVRGGFGEGRMVVAKEAVALGMADRIETLDETIDRLARGGFRRKNRNASSVYTTLTPEELEEICQTTDLFDAAQPVFGFELSREDIEAEELEEDQELEEISELRRKQKMRRLRFELDH
jgi:ClpP class serine protease